MSWPATFLASVVEFPREKVNDAMPHFSRVVNKLALLAGTPFEWVFFMLLPVIGAASAPARLWLNELFLIPPISWINLMVDSGASKSSIHALLGELVCMYEKGLLDRALLRLREKRGFVVRQQRKCC